jgi:hypothetical protein
MGGAGLEAGCDENSWSEEHFAAWRLNTLEKRSSDGMVRGLSGDRIMPAKSKAQQMAAGAALAAKRGEKKKSELRGASKSMVESMNEQQLHDMAATKRKGKPGHASKS